LLETFNPGHGWAVRSDLLRVHLQSASQRRLERSGREFRERVNRENPGQLERPSADFLFATGVDTGDHEGPPRNGHDLTEGIVPAHRKNKIDPLHPGRQRLNELVESDALQTLADLVQLRTML